MILGVTIVDEFCEDNIQSIEITEAIKEEIKKILKHKEVFKLDSSLSVRFVSYFPKLFIDGKYDEEKCYEYKVHVVLYDNWFYIQGYYYEDSVYNEVFCSDSVTYSQLGVEDD